MESVKFNIYFNKHNADLTSSNSLKATIQRENKAIPSNVEIVGASVRFVEIKAYNSSNGQDLGYFDVSFSAQSSGSLTLDTSVSRDILNVTKSGTDVSVGISGKVNIRDGHSPDAVLTVKYNVIVSPSTATLSHSSINAGETMTVTQANSNISQLNHQVVWSIGTKSDTVVVANGVSSISYTIPKEWSEELPNDTSGIGRVVVRTLEGTSDRGSVEYRFILKVPEDIVPSIESIAVTRIGEHPDAIGNAYIQNKSGIKIESVNASGAYGSSISLFRFSGIIESSQLQSSLTINKVSKSGQVTLEITCIDSRGRTSNTVSQDINILSYSPPSITSCDATRCDAAGDPSEIGTYIATKINWSGSTILIDGQNVNGIETKCEYQRYGDESWTVGKTNMVKDTKYVIGEGTIGADYTYRVRFIITDLFTTVERVIDVNTSQYALFLRKGGMGVGIGMACQEDSTVSFNPNWRQKYGTYFLKPIVYSAEQPIDAYEGLIWLQPIESAASQTSE